VRHLLAALAVVVWVAFSTVAILHGRTALWGVGIGVTATAAVILMLATLRRKA
jgi:hypothetical protein